MIRYDARYTQSQIYSTLSMVRQLYPGLGRLTVQVSRSHSDTSHSVGTPLEEWSARRSDLNLTTRNTHKIQTAMPPAVFEHQINILDGATTATGIWDSERYRTINIYCYTWTWDACLFTLSRDCKMSTFKTKRRGESSNVKERTDIKTDLVKLLARYYANN